MRIVTAEEAVAGIQSGDQLYLHCAAATPSVLLDALGPRPSKEKPRVSGAFLRVIARLAQWQPLTIPCSRSVLTPLVQ
jgi:hypothetical protein